MTLYSHPNFHPYLEPCCIQKHLGEYLECTSPTSFFSNSDWGLAQLLEILSLHIPGGELTVCLPAVTDDVTRKLLHLLTSLKSVRQVNLLTNSRIPPNLLSGLPDKRTFLIARYPIGFRTVAIRNENRSAVITGSFNQQPMQLGRELQHFLLCTDTLSYDTTMSAINSILKFHTIT